MDDSDEISEAYSTKLNGFAANLERATLHLISIILADKPLQEMYEKYDLSHMEPFIEEIKESEIVQLLVEISTQYRLIEWNADSEWKNEDFKTEMVGVLEIEGNEKEIDLTMREACNKILHADKLKFDVSNVPDTKYRYYLNPRIITYGRKGKENWKANIDILLFCNAANQPAESIF